MEAPSVQKNVEDVEDDKSENNSNNTEGKGLSGRLVAITKQRSSKQFFFLLRAHSLTKFQTAVAVMLIMCDARNI